MSYRWPGNVRELKNAVESMVLLARGPTIGPDAVPPYVRPAAGDTPDILKSLSGLPMEDVERALITNTLRDVSGNRERASQLLGISARTLYRKIKAFGLSRRAGSADRK